jgi:hypothetical protein
MTRSASSAFLTELQREAGARPFVLIEGLFDGDPWRSWTGIGRLIWDGKIWIGLGTIVSISAPTESSDGRANGLVLTMNSGDGVDPSRYVARVLATHVQGRPVRIWWGFMTDAGAIVSSPLLVYSGFMDQPRIIDRGGECRIELRCEQELIDQSRAVKFRLSPSRLQENSPGDRGFDHIAAVEDVNVPWPRAGFGG